MYNFVDSMFVSQASEKALTVLSLAAPVQLLVSALGLGNAVGLNAVISKALGRKDTGEVRRAADAAIFIFGLFEVPRLETLGAAIATVIGQTAGMFAGIVINRKWNREIPFGFTLRPDKNSILNILKVGFPSTLVQILTSFVGILFYLPFFAGLEIMTAGVLRIFEASDYMLEIGIPALVISAGLQGLSMGMSSMILTMARQAVLPLLFAGIFSRFGNLSLLWMGFILPKFLGIPLAVWFWKRGYGQIQGGKIG